MKTSLVIAIMLSMLSILEGADKQDKKISFLFKFMNGRPSVRKDILYNSETQLISSSDLKERVIDAIYELSPAEQQNFLPIPTLPNVEQQKHFQFNVILDGKIILNDISTDNSVTIKNCGATTVLHVVSDRRNTEQLSIKLQNEQ